MKKQELIHLHGLLAEVRTQAEMWGKDMDLREYENLGVKPASIHKSKTDHKEAVFELADSIAEEIDPVERDYLSNDLGGTKNDSAVREPQEVSQEEENFIGVELPGNTGLGGELKETYEGLVEYGKRNSDIDQETGNLSFRIESEFFDLFEDSGYWEKVQTIRNLKNEGYIQSRGSTPINMGSELIVPVEEKEDSDIIESYLTAS